MSTTDLKLQQLADDTFGIIRRSAAHRVGITDAAIRTRVHTGALRQTGPHTFRLFAAPASPIAQLIALTTDLADDALACRNSAAALHGFDGFSLRAPFDVLIPRNRNMRRIGHRIHTTSDLDLIDRAVVQGCPTTSGARTLIDLARTESPEALTTALDSGLRDGIFSEDLLHRRIVALRRSGRVGIPKLLRVIEGHEITSGAHSWLEREFLRIVAAAGLPRPLTQQVLSSAGDRLVRVDFHFAGTPIVIEVLGYRYHRSPSQMRRDAERQNALLRDGYLPFSFTYDQVVNEALSVTNGVAVALALQATG